MDRAKQEEKEEMMSLKSEFCSRLYFYEKHFVWLSIPILFLIVTAMVMPELFFDESISSDVRQQDNLDDLLLFGFVFGVYGGILQTVFVIGSFTNSCFYKFNISPYHWSKRFVRTFKLALFFIVNYDPDEIEHNVSKLQKSLTPKDPDDEIRNALKHLTDTLREVKQLRQDNERLEKENKRLRGKQSDDNQEND